MGALYGVGIPRIPMAWANHRSKEELLGDIDLHDLPGPQFHDDEDVECSEPDGVLDAEVAGPDGADLVLEERPPTLRGPAGPRGLHHVLANGRLRVRDAELDLQLQGDAVLAVVGVIAGDPSDKLDVLALDVWPALTDLQARFGGR